MTYFITPHAFRKAADRAAAVTALTLALALGPVQPAAADSGLVGGIVGGIIGGAIVNGVNQHRTYYRQRVYRVPAPGISSATREQNRETQVALNYFGFPVGAPDGALGARSRGAIAEFQATLGYPPTGELNGFEREFLVQSYYRAQSGGALVMNQIATDPRGARGVLVTWRDERLGISRQPTPDVAETPETPETPAAPTVAAAPAVTAPPATAQPATSQSGTTAPDAAPAIPAFGATMASGSGSGLPSFMGQQGGEASLASYCNKVSLVTNSNGGFVTEATMKDPAFALSEQFCLARTYAMAKGEELAAKVTGFTPTQITKQCEGFGPVLKDQRAALSLKPRDAVLSDMSSFVLASGMAPAQLGGTARICLGVGYMTDNMDVAIGSALILTTLGDRGYAELLGHHLMAGIGAARRPDLALSWFDMGHDAGKDGTQLVFAPGMTDRGDLIRRAAYATAGEPVPGDGATDAPVKAGLPSFTTPEKAPANP